VNRVGNFRFPYLGKFGFLLTFNDRFHAFCRYWDVTPKACAPYRARTKGKDERGVGYVRGGPRQLDRFPSVLSVKPCGLSRL
jgi:hypothetical protein